MHGNVIDIAVSIIMGDAFGKIISSMVADIIIPPVGLLVGGTNFSELRWELEPARVINGVERAAVTINYESFIQTTLGFVIIAFAIFLFIRLLFNLRREGEEAPLPPPAPSSGEKLFSKIRGLIRKQ